MYKIIYQQNDINDYENLKKCCKCFYLFFDESHSPKGLYNGILK